MGVVDCLGLLVWLMVVCFVVANLLLFGWWVMLCWSVSALVVLLTSVDCCD